MRRAAASVAPPASSRRLSILTQREIDDLYGLPRFTEEDRQLYFDLSAAEQACVRAMHTNSAKVHFVLQLGYFKAKRQFFAYPYDAVQEDLRHILERHFPGRTLTTINKLSKPTRLEQQQAILNLFNYTRGGKAAKQDLERKAQRIAMRSTQPIYTHMLERAITPEVAKHLQALLESDEGLYQLTILKHEPKDFSHKELRQESERRRFLHPLYEFAQGFLSAAGLSNDSVRYYASLVEFYTVYKLQRMAPPTARLYLLCFAYHCLQEINDNLIEAFIHLVNGYERDAKLSAKESVYQAKTAAAANLKAAGQVLNLFVDPSIPTHTPFGTVQEKAFTLLPREQFPSIAHYMSDAGFDEAGFEWAYYVRMSHAFKVNLRHLFAALDFAGRVENTPLLTLIRK
jgi:hypothetical protein